MANHLAGETSPYLLQHAGNPVDWYPWGQEALSKARAEDKPIFLSIGYSSCHWCHVMEHQSFEKQDIADFLNEHFVSIKVDREERPDLDAVYMDAVRALTGGGGWPLSVWITPEGDPFFGGTYFPPQPMRGTPSFRQVLEAIADAWVTKRDSLAETAGAVRDHLMRQAAAPDGAAAPGAGAAAQAPPDYATLLDRADDDLHASADPKDGGWGGAPKFPQSMVLEYLLARQTVKPRPGLHLDTRVTLDAMAAGGMYDHVGGGFHRYSTDGVWLVPHFEKMLYDNAQLARCYTHAWQSLGIARYGTVATETLDYLLREMRHERGGFFSAQDADTSEGEGIYFTWTPGEVREALDPEEAALVERTYGLTAQGNFEHRNILHIAADFPLPDAEPGPDDAVLTRARAKLLAVRGTRPQPARDDKVLAAWNGLALVAFADAATAFASPAYRAAAEKAGEFLLGEMTTQATGPDSGKGGGAVASGGADSRAAASTPAGPVTTLSLLHSWKDGPRPGEGFLDDYACVAEGFLALYGCTLDERWFVAARALADTILQRFARAAGGFYDTSAEHEALITRPRATYDSPTPSGTAMAATVLLKLAAYTGEDHYRRAGEEALSSLAAVADAAPVMSGQWLCAALAAHEGLAEVAIVGELDAPEAAALLDEARRHFHPLTALAAREAGASSEIALLLDREPAPGSRGAAWVCRHSTCAAPVTDPAELRSLLAAG